MANILGLANHVQQQGELGRARGTEQRLNRLTGQAVAAPDPQAREQFVQQAVAADPQSGFALQDRLQQQDDTRGLKARNAAKFVLDAWSSGEGQNATAANSAYQMVRPFLVEEGRKYGKEPPAAFDPGMIQNIEAIVAMNSGGAPAGSNIQSTYVDADGNRVAIFRDGTSRVLGANNQSIRVLEPEGAVPYGVVTSGGRAGEMVNIGGGAAAHAPAAAVAATGSQDDEVAARANAYYQRLRSAGLDDATATGLTTEYLGDMGYRQGPPAGGAAPQPPARQPVVFDPINGGIQQPPRTPTAAEKAAEAEAARRRVALDFAPAEAAAEAEAAQKKAEAEALAKRRAELPKVVGQADAMLTAIDGLRRHPGRALITGWSGMVNPRAYAPGGPAAGAKAFLNQITGQSFLQAFESLKGGGQITEVEGQKATQAIARLDTAQGDEEFLSALNDLYSVVESARDRAKAGAGQPSETAASGGWGIQRVK